MPRKNSTATKNRLRDSDKKILMDLIRATPGTIAQRIHTVHQELTKRGGVKITYGNGKRINLESIKYFVTQMFKNQQITADSALSDQYAMNALAGEMSSKSPSLKLELQDISYINIIDKLRHNANVLAQLANHLFREANQLEQMEERNKFSGSGDMFKLVSDFVSNLSDEEKEEVASNIQA